MAIDLSSGSVYRINGVVITDTTYTEGNNITIDTNNNIIVNSLLVNMSSITSTLNNNLNLQASEASNSINLTIG